MAYSHANTVTHTFMKVVLTQTLPTQITNEQDGDHTASNVALYQNLIYGFK
jgi:hypothetical protein